MIYSRIENIEKAINNDQNGVPIVPGDVILYSSSKYGIRRARVGKIVFRLVNDYRGKGEIKTYMVVYPFDKTRRWVYPVIIYRLDKVVVEKPS